MNDSILEIEISQVMDQAGEPEKNDSQLTAIGGLKRVYIKNVYPEIDNGRYPIKRCVGDVVTVYADILADGFDDIAAQLQFRKSQTNTWLNAPFVFLNNDRFMSSFNVDSMGIYEYRLIAWIDEFKTWRSALQKKVAAQVDPSTELQIGTLLIRQASVRSLPKIVDVFLSALQTANIHDVLTLINDVELEKWMMEHIPKKCISQYSHILQVVVDRRRARFSSWYEVFPRSLSKEHKHGTFQDLIDFLPHIKNLGFDVVYLPPIHPIGHTHRKGKNNSNTATEEDPGSPWAIGDESGGHQSIHPELGNFKDFHALIETAKQLNIDIALDFALQCSPDHLYLKHHPEWFKHRPDGTLQYAENPPKKYEDIYPFYFESPAWQSLWLECQKILLFWIEKGVKIFRVDNPHTKPFIFWEWLIKSIKEKHPDVLFLAEAFTRPKIMYELAKIGFTQSYTYFTWRNSKKEITEYLHELISEPICEFFHPNFWPNTPDILHEYFQKGGPTAFKIRLLLAATLSSNYGIYGLPYEFCINEPLHTGSEEYWHSEKYEIKSWRTLKADTISDFIARVNQIRHDYPAFHDLRTLKFHHIDNGELIAYSKESNNQVLLTIINLNPNHKQSGFIEFSPSHSHHGDHFIVCDLLTSERYEWHGHRHFIELDPIYKSGHVFLVEPRVKS